MSRTGPYVMLFPISYYSHFNLTKMKTVKFLIVAVLAIVAGTNAFAQVQDHNTLASTKTETIKVYGNCDMCKTRIEKAAKIEGVSKAEWSDETKLLTLVYDPSKVNSDDVQKKIAAVGHDTGKFKADDKVYNGLPGCCKYERSK
jgi:mercuric ion binding protein